MLLRYLLPKVESVEEIENVTQKLKGFSFGLTVAALAIANYFMPAMAFVAFLLIFIVLGVVIKLIVTLEVMVSTGKEIKSDLEKSGAIIIAPDRTGDRKAKAS